MFQLCLVVTLSVVGLLFLTCPVTLRSVWQVLWLLLPVGKKEVGLNVVYCNSSAFCSSVIQTCSILRRRYSPPTWGYIGHVQTLLYGIVGRFVDSTKVKGKRIYLQSCDGSTVTYDLFEPKQGGRIREEVMLVVPGIMNCSETNYVRAFALFSTQRGYRTAVLNHVGCLKNTPLNGHRIFSYGGTGDLSLLYDDLQRRVGESSMFIGVGYSMGALILLRFLGEDPTRQEKFLCAFSFCQAYDAVKTFQFLRWWKEGLGIYNYVITRRMVSLLRTHRDALFSSKSCDLVADTKSSEALPHLNNGRDSNGFSFSRWQPPDPSVWSARTIVELDEYYTRRVMGFSSVKELHQWSACLGDMYKIKHLPIVLVNACDDIIVPQELYDLPSQYPQHNHNAMFIATDYGGHLGFFEGSFFSPAPLSWLDRLVFEYVDAARVVLRSL